MASPGNSLYVSQVSLTTNTAIYRISLTEVPTENFTNASIVFTSTLTQQRLVVMVSYVSVNNDGACVADHPSSIHVQNLGLHDNKWYIVLISVIVLLLSTIVVCLALQQSSSRPRGGFSTHLPPPSSTSSPAFIPRNASTPNFTSPGMTPLFSHTSGPSAFTQTRYSPNRQSPQHGLFSQNWQQCQSQKNRYCVTDTCIMWILVIDMCWFVKILIRLLNFSPVTITINIFRSYKLFIYRIDTCTCSVHCECFSNLLICPSSCHLCSALYTTPTSTICMFCKYMYSNSQNYRHGHK